ncbi:MAG: autotransporter outer membrane beta-barrel domain-containing protein, partial [Planctomycetaceae bacterium]|nr:autotransporter outer membrane beta-barrel domain-containing protein [Planctomycetaceae bacterium]
GGGGGGNSNLGFGRNGPAYNFNYGGLQVGDNLICHSELNHAGLYFNAATARSHVLDANSAPAGRITTDAYGFGGYWTHHNQNGWYTDLVLQTNWYENIRTRSVHGDVFDTRGWSFAASGETGYMFAFANGYSIIPQGQLIYQRTSINSGADSFARIHYDATDEVYGRLGVRLAKNRDTNNRRVTTWTETNFWHQFGGDARTTFTSLQGNNPATVTSPLGGTWAQIGLGLSGRLTDHVNAFGAADYNIEMERAGHSFGGQVGVEIGW